MNAKLIMCNIPSTDLKRAVDFYSKLLGTDINFARSLTDQVESYHRPISNDGIHLSLTTRQHDEERAVCYFAVDDLQDAIASLQNAGGQVLHGPVDLPISSKAVNQYHKEVQQSQPSITTANTAGKFAIMCDTEKNMVGLVELHPQTHQVFKYGSFRQPLGKDEIAQQQRAEGLGKRI